MSEFKVGDLATITGPLTHDGDLGWCDLTPGEVVVVVEGRQPGLLDTVRVIGRESEVLQWIDISSLTPLDEIEFQIHLPTEQTVVFRLTGHTDLESALMALELAGTDESLQMLRSAFEGA